MKILSSFINFHFPKLVWFSVFLRAQKEMFGWMFTARFSFAYSESEWCAEVEVFTVTFDQSNAFKKTLKK